jgi:gliding motility-associated-like protein
MRLNVRLTIFLCLFTFSVFSQRFSNSSFEGSPMGNFPPPNWNPCNTYSTPDTQPGFWNCSLPPSDGNSYVSLVTRGDLGPYANTVEAVGTMINGTLKIGNQYHFKIDLAISDTWGHNIGDFGDPPFLSYYQPVVLKIWGGINSCSKEELLWESNAVTSLGWQTYSFTVKPQKTDIVFIVLEAGYASQPTYFGNILIDNLGECKMENYLPKDTVICESETLVLDATVLNGKYQWSTGSSDSKIEVSEPGVYSVDVDNGCFTSTFQTNVTVDVCSCSLSSGNVFTPNGDGHNDIFEISTRSNVAKYQLEIVNRWGNVVFRSNKIENSWDGKINNKKAESGEYYWIATISCIYKNTIIDKVIKGNVSVLY